MARLIIILVCLLLALPAPARAERAALDEAHFKDWITLSALLRSKGLDPVRINWLAIEPMCLGFKKQDSETLYNRCKYEKARDEAAYGGDAAYCRHQAVLVAPVGVHARRRIVHSASLRYEVVDNHFGTIPAHDYALLRENSFEGCMRGQGWISPYGWGQGRD